MDKKPLIGLDVDGVLANIAEVMITIYNYKSLIGEFSFYNKPTYVIDDIVDYNFEKLIGEECFHEVVRTMEDKKICSKLPVYKDAKRMFIELSEIGDVVFVTKPFKRYTNWYIERNDWLLNNFGFNDVIYVDKKHLVNVDILIDDCPHILSDWASFTSKPSIKVERPWNKDFSRSNVSCAKTLNEIPKLIKSIFCI